MNLGVEKSSNTDSSEGWHPTGEAKMPRLSSTNWHRFQALCGCFDNKVERICQESSLRRHLQHIRRADESRGQHLIERWYLRSCIPYLILDRTAVRKGAYKFVCT